MKKIPYIFYSLGMISALGSAIINATNNESFYWQLNCALWIGICILLELRMDNLKDN